MHLFVGRRPAEVSIRVRHVAVERSDRRVDEPRHGQAATPSMVTSNSGLVATMLSMSSRFQIRAMWGNTVAALCFVGDHPSRGGEIGVHAALEVKGEVRIGREIGDVASLEPRHAADVHPPADVVEDDLDAVGVARLATGRGDVDDAAAAERVTDGLVERCRGHGASPEWSVLLAREPSA